MILSFLCFQLVVLEFLVGHSLCCTDIYIHAHSLCTCSCAHFFQCSLLQKLQLFVHILTFARQNDSVSTLSSGRLTISLKYGHHLSNKAHSSHPESYEQTNYFIICDTDVFLRYWQCFVTYLSISLLWVCTYYRCLHLNECSLCYYCSYN